MSTMSPQYDQLKRPSGINCNPYFSISFWSVIFERVELNPGPLIEWARVCGIRFIRRQNLERMKGFLLSS